MNIYTRAIQFIKRFRKNAFLFSELVNRDFHQKYKRTTLGMAWSILSPMLTLLVMRIVFTQFFGARTEHYTTYLFCGNLVLSYYREATTNGMNALLWNSEIIQKVNVPKYLFILSKNVSALLNFGLTMIVFFLFCIFDKITFTPRMFLLVYPIFWLLILNVGVGMVLSAMYVFFRDTSYLYSVFLMLLTYMSAIFYTVDGYSPKVQRMFLLNPVYVIIKYFRLIVIDMQVPSPMYHLLCALYGTIALAVGCLVYKKYNHEFIYYL